jgi:hypothetical protein
MEDRYEIDMTQDAKDRPEGHEKVPIEIDKIVIKRLSNKENIDQGESCETITVGTYITCRTCFAMVVEGEVLAFNTHNRMVIIRPTPTSGQPLSNGLHMVNLDFIEDTRAVRMCTNMPSEPTDFDAKRLNVSEGTEKEQYANTSSDLDDQQNYCVTGQTETADDTEMLAVHKIYQEEIEDEAYTEKIAVPGTVTYENPQNYNMPSQRGAKDVATVALEKGEANVREIPYSIDVPGAVANNKDKQTNGMADKMETKSIAMTAITSDERGAGGHN